MTSVEAAIPQQDELIDHEDDLAQEFSAILAAEIDREIVDTLVLSSNVVDKGWHQLMTPYPMLEDDWTAIEQWCQEMLTGQFCTAGSRMAFEYEADAVLFRLRWL